jgi:hypothetical protein
MTKAIAALFLVTLLFSCSPKIPESIKKRVKTCYDPKQNVASSKVNTAGYFRQRKTTWYDDTKTSSVIIHYFMFFEDGIYWSGIYDHEEGGNRIDIDEYFNKLIANPGGFESQIQRGAFRQGLYSIHGDTIRAQSFNNPAPPYQYVLVSDAFKIIDANTVQQIELPSNIKAEPASFVPIKAPIKSDSWLQREDWIYCNPADVPVRSKK